MADDNDEALASLERQARRLDVAYSIIQGVHADISLDGVLGGIVQNLVDVGGFAGAKIKIDSELDGFRVVRETAAGSLDGDESLVRDTAVFIRGFEIGLLSTRYPTSEAAEELSELLEFILPTLYMGIDHAIAFAEVMDYRRTLENKVEERTAQLAEAHTQLERTHEDLKEAKASRDRFFANINHEIRTPLTLIQLSTDGITREPNISAGMREKLDSVNASTRRLLHLVNSLLQLAAGDEGKLRIRPRPLDVASVLQKLVANWQPAANQGGISLAYAGPTTCDASMDEAALETIVGNFVSNAMKFTPRDGRISVTLDAVDTNITIAVRDTGPGIDPDLVPRLFGRFERAASAHAKGVRGTGIGLSLSKELVELQGGTVSVLRHTDPTGTTFEVTLPRHQSVSAIAASTAEERQPVSPFVPRRETVIQSLDTVDLPQPRAAETTEPDATILLAEDDPALSRNIAELLSTKYRVLTAPNGRVALDMAKEHVPDLLVTDLEMPEMNGIELTKAFLQLQGQGMSPVLIVSAHAGLGERLAGFEAGAVDYVVKPFSADELMARVRSQLAIRRLAFKLHESEKLASLGMLSAGLAHEIRNPANALVNALRPLLELLPEAERQPESMGGLLAEVAMSAADQIRERCMNILDYSRSELVTRHPEDLTALITRTCRLLSDKLSRVELRKDIQIARPISCAGPLIEQILINLLDNAGYAAGNGGWVRIAARDEGKHVWIEVGDSGSGVPAHLQDRIFDPFFTTKPAGEGTGLGLAISRRIALNHGGDLRVIRHETGTVFRLELPTLDDTYA